MPLTLTATLTIGDDDLAALCAALAESAAPPSLSLGVTPRLDLPGERVLDVEFPKQWQVAEERTAESYTWPQGDEHYDPFTVYEGTTSRGTIRLGIGRCRRERVWGRDRAYLITFHVTEGGKRPLCEFLETDDHWKTGKLIAIIRGTGASKRGMYPPGSPLPGAYRSMETVRYSDHIRADRAWNRQAVLAHELDVETMLNHSLIQADHRFGIRPE